VSRRAQENVLAGLLVVFFVGYIAVALGFGPNARLVPLPMAGIGLLCLLVQIVRQNRPGGLRKNTFGPLALITGGRPTEEPEAEADTREPSRVFERELRAFGFVGGFAVLIAALGPVPAVFLFSAAFLAISKHYPLWKAVAVAGAFAVLLYLLFVVGLELQLYHGLLAPLVDRF
jgi:Tripartite tricarboxylate transporter TctB family